MNADVLARLFRFLNRWFMVPTLRAGLGAWVATPFGGYIVLLRVRGRRSGLLRDVPLSYLVADGSAWVFAGFGPQTQWFRNILAEPEVECWLPGRTVRCRAVVVEDPEVRARITPLLVRAAGVPGAMTGANPWHTPDAAITAAVAEVPLLRLVPEGEPLVAGPDDPGGWAWAWRQAVVLALTIGLVSLGRGLLRGR
jgi:deazaflavin-dependent oxidoreductase (nitroreductase family)